MSDPDRPDPTSTEPTPTVDDLALEAAVIAGAGDLGDDEGPADVAAGVLDRFAPFRALDLHADHVFDRLRGNPVADRTFYALTELGDFGLIWLLLGAARGLRSDDEAEEFLRLAVALGVESVVVNGALKSMFRRERPVVQEPRPHRLRIPLTTSFPSGHASSAMLAATLLGEGRRTLPLYLGLGAWVASTRVYVRIHHASDVVAGLALGLGLGAVARRAWPGPRSRHRRR